MKRKNIAGTISLLIIGTVFGAILVSSFGLVKPSLAIESIGSTNPPINIQSSESQSFNDAFVNVAEKVTPSIVRISVITESKENPHDGLKFFFPFKDQNPLEKDVPFESKGSGSGVIISEDGYILTNNHVVENAKKVTVGLIDKREFDAEVVGKDPLTDLAVIKIDAKNLTSSYLGNSDELKVGTWVMAIGNPLSLSSTVTAGIVSAIGRNLNMIKDSYGVENYIQTDAAINPGNSGGALVNLNGAVIGINSAIATNGMTSSYIGYGFAIPINLAKSVAEDLIANGEVSRGYIGVNISEVDASTAKAVGLDKPQGIMIQGIVKDGAAEDKDIEPGDIILSVDGKKVDMPNQLQGYVAAKRAGDDVKLKIYRSGETFERTVTLKEKNSSKSVELIGEKGDKRKDVDNEIKEMEYDEIGLTVQNATKSQLEKFKQEYGVLITKVKKYSKAADQKLVPGLLIIEVNKKSIASISEFDNIISESAGEAVLLKVVYGDGNSRYVGLEIPD